MSVFDGFSPGPWLAEKTLASLEVAASFVDLANEPDTTEWYRKTLLHKAKLLVGRLAPAVALLNGAEEEAASHEEWGLILESGTFGLAKWCKAWGIVDPVQAEFDAYAADRDDDEYEAKSEDPEDDDEEFDDLDHLLLQRRIHEYVFYQLQFGDLSDAERRLLTFLGYNLTWSMRGPDQVAVSKLFLPTDIDATVEETAEAYESLYERGLIERTYPENLAEEAICLRLVVDGLNDRKHPEPFEPVEFGGAGTRLDGESTTGQTVVVQLDDVEARTQQAWGLIDEDDLEAIKSRLIEQVGDDRIYVNVIEFTNEERTGVRVQYRHPVSDIGNRLLELLVEGTIRLYIRDRLAERVSRGGD